MNKTWKSKARKELFGLIVSICLLALTVLGSIWISSTREYMRDNIVTTSQLALGAMGQTTDLVLQDCDVSIDKIVQNVDVINLLVVPNIPDYSRDRSVLLMLNSMTGSSYKKSISIYHPWLDACFSSDMTTRAFEDSDIYDAVLQFKDSYHALQGFGEGKHDKSRILLTEDGRLFIMRSFPRYDSEMGVVAIEIDTENLISDLTRGIRLADADVMVLSPEKLILMNLNQDREGQQFEDFPQGGVMADVWADKESELFISRSGYSGLYFVIDSRGSFGAWTGKTLAKSILTIICIAFAQLFAAWFVVVRILRPIEKLVDLMVSSRELSEGDNRSMQERYGYLNSAYTQVAEHQSSVRNSLLHLQYTIINQLIISAYANAMISENELKDINNVLLMQINVFPHSRLLLFRLVGGEELFTKAEKNSTMLEMGVHSAFEAETKRFGFSVQHICVDDKTIITLVTYRDDNENYAEAYYSIQHAKARLEEAFSGRLITILSEEVSNAEGLYKETKWLKLMVNAHEHAAKGSSCTEEIMTSKSMSEELAGIEVQLHTSIEEAFERHDPSGVFSYLSSLKSSGEKMELKWYCIFSLYASALSSVCLESMPAAVGEFVEPAVTAFETLLSRHEDIDVLSNRARLILSSAVRIYKQNQAAGSSELMKRVLQIIDNNYAMPNFSLGAIADEINVSNSRLSKTFKECMDNTFVNYMLKYKIEKAQYILLDTDKGLADIALTVGFATVQHFIRSFKQETGYTPGAYRSAFKGTSDNK